STRRPPLLVRLGITTVKWFAIAVGIDLLVGTLVIPAYDAIVPSPAKPLPAAVRSIEWWAEYQTELPKSKYAPFVWARSADWSGKYINVHDALRGTYRASPPSDARALHVGVFGGSTVWGVGARDDHTIPSELARVAELRGVALDVVNYGEINWTSRQAVILL